MTKAPQAFRTISEVSETLDVPQHVLRFWEGKFPQIRPLKRAGGRRYYRPEDIELLRGVRALLYAEGYTIKGVQKLLRTSGARYVCNIGRYGVMRADRNSGMDIERPRNTVALDQAADDVETGDWIEEATDDEAESASIDGVEVDSEEPNEAASIDREKLEAALNELLALRDMLRAARPKRAAAA